MVIQSSAVAAELLEDRREQDEMVTMFVNFEANTGWKLQKIVLFLKMQWGRQNERESSLKGLFVSNNLQCPSLTHPPQHPPPPSPSSHGSRR